MMTGDGADIVPMQAVNKTKIRINTDKRLVLCDGSIRNSLSAFGRWGLYRAIGQWRGSCSDSNYYFSVQTELQLANTLVFYCPGVIRAVLEHPNHDFITTMHIKFLEDI